MLLLIFAGSAAPIYSGGGIPWWNVYQFGQKRTKTRAEIEEVAELPMVAALQKPPMPPPAKLRPNELNVAAREYLERLKARPVARPAPQISAQQLAHQATIQAMRQAEEKATRQRMEQLLIEDDDEEIFMLMH